VGATVGHVLQHSPFVQVPSPSHRPISPQLTALRRQVDGAVQTAETWDVWEGRRKKIIKRKTTTANTRFTMVL